MPLVHIFTRHRKTCSKLADSQWKRCACPKFLHWSEDGKFKRVSAKTSRWEDACRVARRVERQLEETIREHVATHSVLVRDAVTMYLADKRSQQLAADTLKKLKTIFEKQLLPWCDAQSVRIMPELDLNRLREWRSTWKDGALSAKKKQERLTGFLHFCVSSGWIRTNPALGLSKIRVRENPTLYFDEADMSKILQGTYEIRNGERLRALVLLMRWSGLAIRDAVTLERSRLNERNQIFLYRAKTGTPVHITIPEDAAETLRTLKSENPRYFFWSGNGKPKSAVADWQRSFRRLFKHVNLCHPDKTPKRVHPHMFRDTFAVECLLAGIPLHDVAMYLGHTSIKTTEKHYAPFVMARMEQMDATIRQTWDRKEIQI